MTTNKLILYSIIVNQAPENGNWPRMELQCISKMVPPWGTYFRRSNPKSTNDLPGAPIFTQINQARTEPDHAHTEPFLSETSKRKNDFLIFEK